MISKIVPAFIALALGVTIGGIGGSRIATRAAQVAAVPCNCPPAAVLHLAPDFDVTKINNKKGTFDYSPTTNFENVTVVIECKDSVLLRQILKAAN